MSCNVKSFFCQPCNVKSMYSLQNDLWEKLSRKNKCEKERTEIYRSGKNEKREK